MPTSSDRSEAIRAISEGRVQVEGEGLPFAFYPKGWITRAEMLERSEVWTHKALVSLICGIEGVKPEAAEARIKAMVREGTLEALEGHRYRVRLLQEDT